MKRYKLTCIVLSIAMVMTMSMPISVSAATNFSDVRGHWAEASVNKAVSKGIIKGYEDGTFKPDNPVSRAEFTSMANRALGCTGSAGNTFNDVRSSDWFYSDVSKAVAATYVAGYDASTFKPNAAISRQEAAVMIARFVPTFGTKGNLRTFPDYSSVSDWAAEALAKVNGKGYLGAYNDGKIHPQDQLTRGQTAKILCDIMDKESIVTSDPMITKDETKLSGRIYTNNVTISKDLGNNEASIENCVILGTLNVQGGGTNTVTVKNCRVAKASANRSADAVRILASGETTIANLTASNESILQTANLSGGSYGLGFAKVNISSSAKTTLKGSFPKVIISGSSAKAVLSSGSISDLTVDSSARRSEITIESGTSVSEATVNAESSFRGTGSISHMNVNADDITYETKPRTWTIGSKVTTPMEGDDAFDIKVSPSNKSTNVRLTSNITLTFNTAMTKYNGKTISNSDVEDLVSLRRDSTSGRTVPFSGTISSSKKVITLDPDSELIDDTRYYVVIDRNVMKDTADKGNVSQTTYFNTGDDDDDNEFVTFDPKHNSSNVSRREKPTLTFTKAIETYSGNTINNSYLDSSVIDFRLRDSGGSSVDFKATINSSKKTITITPEDDLKDDQKYYLAIKKNKLRTQSGHETIPSSSVTWSTGTIEADNPTIKSVSAVATDTTLAVSVTPNLTGYVYGILVPTGTSRPSTSQVISGKDGNNSSQPSGSAYISANSSQVLRTFSGLTAGKTYDFYGVLQANNKTSSLASYSFTTKSSGVVPPEPPKSASTLSNITVAGATLSPSFSAGALSYTAKLPFSADTAKSVNVIATAGSGVRISFDNLATSNPGSNSANVNLSNEGKATVTITAFEPAAQKTASTYTVNIKMDGNTDVKSVSVANANAEILEPNTVFSLPATSTTADVTITAADTNATISGDLNGTKGSASAQISVSSSSATKVKFKIVSQESEKSYEITIYVKQPPTPPVEPTSPPAIGLLMPNRYF